MDISYREDPANYHQDHEVVRFSIEVWADGVRWLRELAFCTDGKIYGRATQLDTDELGRWHWEGSTWSKMAVLQAGAKAAKAKGWTVEWAHPGLESEAGAKLVKTVAF